MQQRPTHSRPNPRNARPPSMLVLALGSAACFLFAALISFHVSVHHPVKDAKGDTSQLTQTEKADLAMLSAARRRVLWLWGVCGFVTGPVVWRRLIGSYRGIR